MAIQKSIPPSDGRAIPASIRRELVGLCAMSLGELVAKYQELFGAPTRTHNREYLRRRIAYRLQEVQEGGLSPRAVERIAELAPHARVRARQPLLARGALEAAVATASPVAAPRDSRLPPTGTVITRMHEAALHRVTVLETGFEYQGTRYRSLSKIAKLITGKDWNGFRFFFGNSKEGNG